MTRKRKAPKNQKQSKKVKEYVDVEPDPNSEEYYYDEIDKFNMDKEKILLGDTLKAQKKTAVEEEVYPIGNEYDSDENEADIQYLEDQIKIHRRLPSAKAALIAPNEFSGEMEEENELEDRRSKTWGKRKADKYGADVAEDFDVSDSEENAALLEEKEALAIQRFHLEQLDESDFDFEKYKKQLNDQKKPGKLVKTDKAQLSLEEQKDLVKKENPELMHIYLDTIQKCNKVQKTLCPIVQAYKKNLLPRHELFDYLQSKLGLYCTYFANAAFYRVLRLKGLRNIQNHPVTEAVFSYIERCKALNRLDQGDKAAVRYVLKLIKKGKPELVTTEAIDQLLGKDIETDVLMQKPKSGIKHVKEETSQKDGLENHANEEDEDRIVDYKIEKNKGITPKRKKINRNPRIKYKEKYRKALIRQRGQRPKHHDQMHPYAGESSGIRIGVQKGIRLKA